MQQIILHQGKLQRICTDASQDGWVDDPLRYFSTGLEKWDDLLPHQRWSRGAVHELLHRPEHPRPLEMAMLLARAVSAKKAGKQVNCILLSDPRREMYPPGFAQRGITLERLIILHPQQKKDETWALVESLRCQAVAATIAVMGQLSRVEARRLQLAAETGGGIGIFLREQGRVSQIYAAATRWLVEPARTSDAGAGSGKQRVVQRWRLTLLHAHGGRIGNSIFLELNRETGVMRAVSFLVDRLSSSAGSPVQAIA